MYNRIEEILKKQARKRIEKNRKADHKQYKNSSKKDEIELKSLPQPTLPQVDMNSLSTNNHYYHHQQQQPRHHYQQHQHQSSFTGSINSNPGRPNYYPQMSSTSNATTLMGSQFTTRRNSLSSVNSDQIGLTSHAQGQPWSSTPYYNNNGSNSNLAYNNHQQTYHYNHYQQHPSQQQQQQNYY